MRNIHEKQEMLCYMLLNLRHSNTDLNHFVHTYYVEVNKVFIHTLYYWLLNPER